MAVEHNRIEEFKNNMDVETVKHTLYGQYNSPHLTNKHANPFLKISIRNVTNGTCCPRVLCDIRCNLCDMKISMIVKGDNNDYSFIAMKRKIPELHRHEFDGTILKIMNIPISDRSKLHNLSIGGGAWNVGTISKLFRKNKSLSVPIKCGLCGWEQIREFLPGGYELRNNIEDDDNYGVSDTIFKHAFYEINWHLRDNCKEIHKERKDASAKYSHDRENIIEMINKTEYDYMKETAGSIARDASLFSNGENTRAYSMVIEEKKCECGTHTYHCCLLCGCKSNLNVRDGLSTFYKRIISGHFRAARTHIKFDYTDTLTPINHRKISNVMTVIRNEYDYDTRTYKPVSAYVPKWICDGYKCSICGVLYEAGEVPGRDIVVKHVRACIKENREKIIESGLLCA